MKMIYGVLVAGLVGLGVMKAHADGEYVRVHELHSFANAYNASHTNPWADAEGGHPAASLYEHTDGMLYGTTTSDGPNQTGDATHSCSSGAWRTSHPEYFAKHCPGTVFRLNKLNQTDSGFAVVYAFAGLDAHDRNTTGYRPYSTLVPGPNGYLYGTATQGGAADGSHAGCGVVFKFLPSHPSATFSIVHHFCACPSFADGATPYGSLVPDGHGAFYGATSQGTTFGNGSLFKLSESSPTTCNGHRSTVTTLHAFGHALDHSVYPAPRGTNTDGAGAFGSPVLDGTTLFGLTHFGGDSSTHTASCGGGFGTVYAYETATRTFSKVQDQACFHSAGLNTDQVSAQSMIVGSDGHYYGTAQFGGANNTGYVFKLVPETGAVTILHSFGAIAAGSSPPYSNAIDGAQPMGTLVEGHGHFLYGTTYYGGRNGTGIIFQMKKTGEDFLILYAFPAAGQHSPGTFPQAGLIQGSDGRYYGTTSQGGAHGFGTVFAMDPPLSFAHTFHAELCTVYESAPIRVAGFASSTIAISNGEYQLDGGPWTSAAGTVAIGQTLRVRVTSSASYNTRVLATVVFGGLGNSSFGVTTKTRPQAAAYTVTDLGTLDGMHSSASGINESGQVVGIQIPPDAPQRAFLYSGGTMTDLGTLGGMHSYATAINATGQVVGMADTPGTGPPHAFLYSGEPMTDLGTLGGIYSFAFGINAAGQVVGAADTLGTGTHAFLYSGERMTDLGTLGGMHSYATAINDSGQIVGAADTPGTGTHAFLYNGERMTDLGTLGGMHSYATAINDSGQVVGAADTLGTGTHAFLYSGERMTDLGTLGGMHSYATAINDSGQIVGVADTLGTGTHAFLSCGGTMTDLNDLVPAGVIVTKATGINAAGQIVGDGRIGGSANVRALLLTPMFSNGFAYALANAPTATSYTPDNGYAYNASGGAITITRQGVGRYDVAFDHRPDWRTRVSSAVAVTAYGSSPFTCSVVGYDSAAPSRTVVQVGCFNFAVDQQPMADSPFTILLVGNQSLPVPSAFVRSGGPAPVLDPAGYWTSVSGREITVTHTGAPGEYNVLLGTGNTSQSAKLVTGTTTGVGTRCHHADHISGGLRMRCYDQSGAATDQNFSVVQVAEGRPGRRIGFAIGHNARHEPGGDPYTPYPNWSLNSAGGAITATRSSVGHYAMHFAGLQQLPGRTEHVQITASSPTLATCNVVNWENVAEGLMVRVECRDEVGEFIDSVYYVLVIE